MKMSVMRRVSCAITYSAWNRPAKASWLPEEGSSASCVISHTLPPIARAESISLLYKVSANKPLPKSIRTVSVATASSPHRATTVTSRLSISAIVP